MSSDSEWPSGSYEAPRHSVRAAMSLTLLKMLRSNYADHADRVLSTLPKEVRDQFDTVTALRWIPMDPHMQLVNAIRKELGYEQNIRFWHDSIHALTERPLLRGFIRMSVRLGTTPRSLLQRTPMIYDHLFQNMGRCLTEVDEDEEAFATVRVRGFPARAYNFRSFYEGFVGALSASGTLFRSKVNAELVHVDPRGEFAIQVSAVA